MSDRRTARNLRGHLLAGPTAGSRCDGAERPDERFCNLSTGIRVCYTTEGDSRRRPLVLIAGIGLDLWSWDPALVARLTDAGLRVIRLDNRDAGRSSQLNYMPSDRSRRISHHRSQDGYSLEDMADDVISLLDQLDVVKVDVVGMSMGGMIGQVIAARHPERVRTLVSIISTTGDRRVGQPARSTRLALMSRPAADADGFALRYRLLQRHIASGPYGVDRAADERWARQAWARMSATPGFVPGAGFGRQIGAIRKSGDRTSALHSIVVPTLVIHGDKDRLVHPSGGAATARAIPSSEFVTVRGLRHHLPASAAPELAGLILQHLRSQ